MKNNWLNWLNWPRAAGSRLGAAVLLALLAVPAFAQSAAAVANDTPEMADALRQSGKIYVVVLVILIILSGLLLYLIRLDRKVSQLERELRDEA